MNQSAHPENNPQQPLSRDQAQRLILDGDWTGQRLELARQLLEAVENDPGLRDSLRDYDALRQTLSAATSEGEHDATALDGGAPTETTDEEQQTINRLLGALDHPGHSTGPVAGRIHRAAPVAAPSRAQRWRWPALALSAAAVLVALLTVAYPWGGGAPGSPGHEAAARDDQGRDQPAPWSTPGSAVVAQQVLDDDLMAFTALAESLGGRLDWLAFEQGGESWVGVPRSASPSEAPASAAHQGGVKVVAVVLERYDGHREVVRLLLRPGAQPQIELPLPGGAKAELHLAYTPGHDLRDGARKLSLMIGLPGAQDTRWIGFEADAAREGEDLPIGRLAGWTVRVQLGETRPLPDSGSNGSDA